MNLRKLANLNFHSSLVRRILGRVYSEGDVCKVRMGPLRGSRLVYHPSINFHAILGLWELDGFRFLQNVLVKGGLLGRDSVVADVGANIGFYALWFARRVRAVHAFEPAPDTQKLLAANLAANDVRNVEVIKAACGASDGTIDFFVSHHHHASSLHADWAKAGHGTEPEKITVPVITLDSYFGDTRKTWPDLIKMDIEGGGTFALPGAARCFAEKRPFLLIESHTPDEDRAVSHILLHNDYQAYRLNTKTWVEDRLDTTPNPQSVGVWGTMFLCPTEKQREVAARI